MTCASSLSPMSPITRLSPQEAFAKMQEGYTYVDVRSETEFDDGHPAGAFNVPLLHARAEGMVPNPDFLAVMRSNFEKDAPLVLGCKAGGRSMRAAEILIADGFTKVLEQRAGWDGARNAFGQVTEAGWVGAKLPAAVEPAPGASYEHLKAKALTK